MIKFFFGKKKNLTRAPEREGVTDAYKKIRKSKRRKIKYDMERVKKLK